MKEWQFIDLNLIKGELEEKENTQEKMQVLRQNYPGLYVYMLKFFDKGVELEQFTKKCKRYGNDRKHGGDSYKYSLYIHCYLIPWLEQQRKDGKLRIGKDPSIFQILLYR